MKAYFLPAIVPHCLACHYRLIPGQLVSSCIPNDGVFQVWLLSLLNGWMGGKIKIKDKLSPAGPGAWADLCKIHIYSSYSQLDLIPGWQFVGF